VIKEGNTVVAIGTGSGTQTAGDILEFAFCTVITFTAGHIRRVDSYIVPLTAATAI
jgi:ketosteroid isomerase-like protein